MIQTTATFLETMPLNILNFETEQRQSELRIATLRHPRSQHRPGRVSSLDPALGVNWENMSRLGTISISHRRK